MPTADGSTTKFIGSAAVVALPIDITDILDGSIYFCRWKQLRPALAA
jgi:hypothetical protein